MLNPPLWVGSLAGLTHVTLKVEQRKNQLSLQWKNWVLTVVWHSQPCWGNLEAGRVGQTRTATRDWVLQCIGGPAFLQNHLGNCKKKSHLTSQTQPILVASDVHLGPWNNVNVYTSSWLKQFGRSTCCNLWLSKIAIPPPQRVIGNSEGEGFLKRKIFKENYARKLEFEDRWGVENKKGFVGGVWISSGKTELTSLIDSSKFYQKKRLQFELLF